MRHLLLIFTIVLTSCFDQSYKVDDFSNEELMWFKPFTKTDTFIFISEKSERDSIIFKAPQFASDSIRSFKQGFHNTTYMTVNYDFTKGSYHQFAMMGDGKTRYSQNFVNTYKSSSGHVTLEICFIGTVFNDTIKHVQKIYDTTFIFDSKEADYSGVNVEKKIKNFTFNTNLGVIEYIDNRHIKWTRK